jgi:hypothetical protein
MLGTDQPVDRVPTGKACGPLGQARAKWHSISRGGGGRHQGLGNIVRHSLARAQHLKRWTHRDKTKFRSAAWEGVKRDLRVEKQAYDSTRQAPSRPDYAEPLTDLGNPIVEWRRAYDPLIRPKLILKTRRACLHRRHPPPGVNGGRGQIVHGKRKAVGSRSRFRSGSGAARALAARPGRTSECQSAHAGTRERGRPARRAPPLPWPCTSRQGRVGLFPDRTGNGALNLAQTVR